MRLVEREKVRDKKIRQKEREREREASRHADTLSFQRVFWFCSTIQPTILHALFWPTGVGIGVGVTRYDPVQITENTSMYNDSSSS